MGGDKIRGRFLRHAALYATLVALVVWSAFCGGGAETDSSPSCSFALSPASASHPASGGGASMTVATGASCAWTATSDVDWVTVTAGSGGQGSGTVTYTVAPNTTASARSASIQVVPVNGKSAAALHQITQQGTKAASSVPVKGAYAFGLEADPGGTCGWPETKFVWPVSVEVTSYAQGTTVGWIVFPPTPSAPSNRWKLDASPAGTQLVPAQGSPGPAAAAYDVVVDGGRWEAGGPTRAPDGRGEITGGVARGATLILRLPGSDQRWECGSDARWSLRTRWVDRD